MDLSGIPALVEVTGHMYGLDATWIETVPERETYNDDVVWSGEVEVSAVDHTQTKRCYAWSHAFKGTKWQFHAVLGVGPIDSRLKVVQASNRRGGEARSELR